MAILHSKYFLAPGNSDCFRGSEPRAGAGRRGVRRGVEHRREPDHHPAEPPGHDLGREAWPGRPPGRWGHADAT